MFSTKYNYKVFKGASWLLIFYHNSNTLFESANEALNCNTNDKFSILNEISSFFKADNKYEFLLEYPKNYPNDFIRWSQSQFPLENEEQAGVSTAADYKPIHVPSYKTVFGGLVKTTIENNGKCISTLLDGNPGNLGWFYSIGMYSTCDTVYTSNKPPGPEGAVDETFLWIRVYLPRLTCNQMRLFNLHFFVQYFIVPFFLETP